MISIKKIFLSTFIILSLNSCADRSLQTVNLDLSLKDVQSNFGNYKKVQLQVYDDRANKEFIGQKVIGEIFVNINSEQNLANLVKENMARALQLKGFNVGDDKILELRISNFEYMAKRGFFTGHSTANILFKITVKDKYDNNKKYQKNYGLTIKKDHFIMPLMKTDEETINYMLQETFNDILKDNNLIENLRN